MEHKAFLFNTKGFEQELCRLIIACGEKNDPEPLREFITNRIGRVRSVYTGELLDHDWEDELEVGNVQELADFSMTCFYDPEEDHGLAYAWDDLLENLKELPASFDHEYVLLGRPVGAGTFQLDPGGMGMGFVQADDVPSLLKGLIECRSTFAEKGMSSDGALNMSGFSELIEAYDELILLYKKAAEHQFGLLFTF